VSTSKPKEKPRKCQRRAISLCGTRSCGEMGIPVGPLWPGGMGIYRCVLRGGDVDL
jgi:hypothetical protein